MCDKDVFDDPEFDADEFDDPKFDADERYELGMNDERDERDEYGDGEW